MFFYAGNWRSYCVALPVMSFDDLGIGAIQKDLLSYLRTRNEIFDKRRDPMTLMAVPGLKLPLIGCPKLRDGVPMVLIKI